MKNFWPNITNFIFRWIWPIFSYWGHSTKLIVFVLVILLAGLLAFLKLGKATFGRLVTMRLLAISFAIGLLVNILNYRTMYNPGHDRLFPRYSIYDQVHRIVPPGTHQRKPAHCIYYHPLFGSYFGNSHEVG